jgi:tRNA-specific 2-thiouridylase
MRKRARGIGLLSGGLDSALSCLVLRDAGADVECLHFFTGFCITAHNSKVGRTNRETTNGVLRVAAEIDVPLDFIDISGEYFPMVLNPKHGYGRNMNPCVDCRVLMLRRARERMEALGADFVFTGEVIGQRLKSQVKRALFEIEKDAGLEGKLLRPLCAKLLPPTEVETSGLVDRQKLHGFTGRGRRQQIALAAHYGLKTYMQPSGGCCFLTDRAYSRKFRDAIEHQGGRPLGPDDVLVFGVGRHFRLSPELRVVVGRDEAENDFLSRRASGGHWVASVIGFTGPKAIVLGEVADAEWVSIGSIVARYSDARSEGSVEVEFVRNGELRRVVTAPAPEEFINAHRI